MQVVQVGELALVVLLARLVERRRRHNAPTVTPNPTDNRSARHTVRRAIIAETTEGGRLR